MLAGPISMITPIEGLLRASKPHLSRNHGFARIFKGEDTASESVKVITIPALTSTKSRLNF